MLAMVVDDDAGCLIPRGVLWFIASMLAPTGNLNAWTYQITGSRCSSLISRVAAGDRSAPARLITP